MAGKGKRAALLLTAALLLAAAALLPRALFPAARTLPPLALGENGRDVLGVQASVYEDLRRVTGEATLTATNRTGAPLDALVLRLFPNGEAEDALIVSSAAVDGCEARISPFGDDGTALAVEADWQPGETRAFSWRFALTIPRGAGACHRDDGEALLVGALPVPTLFEGGAWRADAWDALAGPLGAARFDYELTLTAPKGVRAAFGGALVSRETDGENAVYTAQATGALDMPFALRTGGALVSREADGVLLTALAETRAKAGKLLSQAEKALAALDELGLACPLTALCVCETDAGAEDGLIGTGLLALDWEKSGEARLRRLTRLLARQTFGVAARNDPWEAPWLSVSLASAAELLCYRHRAGGNAYEERFFSEVEPALRLTRPRGVRVGAGTASFGGDAEMTQVLRDQGAAMLLGIEEAVGEEAFLQALRRYVALAGDGPGTAELLEQALFEATGSRWDGYLADGLAD